MQQGKASQAIPSGGEIAQRDLRNNSAEILRKVQRGAHYTVTVRGKPVAEITPFKQRQAFVKGETLRDFLEALEPDPTLLSEIDEAVDARIDI